MKDVRGVDVKIGDVVAWGIRSGNTGDIDHGFICDIDEDAAKFKVWRGVTQKKSNWINWYSYGRKRADGSWTGSVKVIRVG